ncbi:hypothetical protein [Candidatus Methylomirabilis sp.]|uniref:hypothetical protein n=1 Tax=Candidatus Methylomirabilis sp. TaxID=2032687 RepID=UPI002A694020|nr:hypothetical protein [Candidatus Methylomirabilis sp.]
MIRCLHDRSLLLIHYGEGRAADLAHLEACATCAGRYRQLVRDLEQIDHALERMPSALTVRPRRRAFWPRRAMVAAMLAAGVIVAGVEVWLWRDTQVLVQRQPTLDEAGTLGFLAEVSAGLSAPSDEETQVLQSARRLTEPEMMLDKEDDDVLGGLGETWTRDDASVEDSWGGDRHENT